MAIMSVLTHPSARDQRPRLAEVFRALRTGKQPIWVAWEGKRLLLGFPDDTWLDRATGPAIIATRRGYRRVVLIGRIAEGGHLTSKRGVPKNQPLRTEEDYFTPIAPKLVRAVILDEEDR